MKRNWFVHARRNAGLFHLSFLMPGLNGQGWEPAVNFRVADVIVLGYKGKGGFVYFDHDELVGERYAGIQKSVDTNQNFVEDFRRKTNEIFGAIFFACNKIEEENLSLLSNTELLKLYDEYIKAVMCAPIITLQVYGPEAMLDPNYKIVPALKNKLRELGEESEFERYKEMLLVNDGETVPFSERKDFLRVCVALRRLGNTDSAEAVNLIDTHIKKYHWVNAEYLGTEWPREKWVNTFREALADPVSPEERLETLMRMSKEAQVAKEALIVKLGFSDDVLHAIKAMGEFLAQRDWAKGYFVSSFPSLNKLLGEIARRMGTTLNDLFNLSYKEIEEYLESGRMVPLSDLALRQAEGYVFIVKNGVLEVLSGIKSIEETIRTEGIDDPTRETEILKEFKGVAASRGKVSGRVRVIDVASKIPEFKDGEILVTYMTTIEFTPLFKKAIAVITDEGGLSCHAAIISREFKLPCIVGTRVATRALKTGDMVEVDAEKGIVRLI